MDISSSISPKIKIDEFEYSPNYEVDHFLTRDFRNAQPLIKEFNYDFSQLDKEDFINFIQLVFEPEFLKLEQGLTARDLYICKALFPIFKSFKNFVPISAAMAGTDSIYYNCRGCIDSLRILVCEKPLFDDDGILLNCLGDLNYKTYLRIKEL